MHERESRVRSLDGHHAPSDDTHGRRTANPRQWLRRLNRSYYSRLSVVRGRYHRNHHEFLRNPHATANQDGCVNSSWRPSAPSTSSQFFYVAISRAVPASRYPQRQSETRIEPRAIAPVCTLGHTVHVDIIVQIGQSDQYYKCESIRNEFWCNAGVVKCKVSGFGRRTFMPQ